MKQLRVSILGFGGVGQGLAELLHAKRDLLRREFDLDIVVVGVANSRHGFIYREAGFDIPTLLELARSRQPLTLHTDVQHWSEPLVGLRATGQAGDILAEITNTESTRC